MLDLLFSEIKSSEEHICLKWILFCAAVKLLKMVFFHSYHLYNHHAWHIIFVILSVLGSIIFLCPLDSNQASVCFWPIETVMAAINASILIIHVIFLHVQFGVQF